MGLFSRLFGKRMPPTPVPERVDPRVASNWSEQASTITAREPSTPSRRPSTPVVEWRAGSFPMEAVGESNYQHNFVAICGPRTSAERDEEHLAVLRLEPSNKHDPNAVQVLIKNRLVGYLPRAHAVRVKEQMERYGINEAQCAARIRGGWYVDEYDEGDYGVWLGVPTYGDFEFRD